MRFVVQLLVMIVVALGVGFGSSWYALNDGRLFGTMEIGPWVAWRDAGAPNPDPYTRAYVSRAGVLQLGASEGLQFSASVDSDGRRLDRACRYRIEGSTPVASFWTLVPVGPDGGIITRPDGRAALNSTRIARAASGAMLLYVSKGLSPRDWLEITGDGPFTLLLTLYDASSFAGVGSAAAQLPAIIREACS